eukprot:5222157-Lingulodinium_polyedra.AAC.1
MFLAILRILAGSQGVRAGKGGRSPQQVAHSSGKGGGSGACQIRRHAASSCRGLAAGPPLRAAIHVL